MLVVGLGEVGRPLLEIATKVCPVLGIDVSSRVADVPAVSVMHVCYPFEIADFVGETVRYIERFRPALTIVNSTVAVGTTRAIAERVEAAVVHSPVRGKHVRMGEELLRYTKFVGALDVAAGKSAAEHFESLGMRTRVLGSPEATELAKLTETTYFGLDDRLGSGGGALLRSVGAGLRRGGFVLRGSEVLPPRQVHARRHRWPLRHAKHRHPEGRVRSELLEAIRRSNDRKVEREATKSGRGRG